ncbi:MAG TPA: class II aldolase/adducin family protein [Bacteroidota bacterium]
MKFAVVSDGYQEERDNVAEALVQTFIAHGDEMGPANNGINFALNLIRSADPRHFRRKSQSVFVFSLIQDERVDDDFKSRCYTALVRSLSNLLLCVVPGERGGVPEIYFTTPEAGSYHLPFDPEAVYQRLRPIATARFATENHFSEDLPERLWMGSPATRDLSRYGKELELMGVLPVPFPLREVLSEDALRQLYKIYGITGASYGNLSARESVPDLGPCTFWMTGRGVNKADLRLVGKDMLLVKGFDHAEGAALIAQPPGADRRARVSVDAVEHELIYRTYPEVGAIVHAHAWIEGVPCTRQNYPCGTRELAAEVAALLATVPDPGRGAVGLKNHGLTITGHTLEEIFSRIRGKLLREVAMFD